MILVTNAITYVGRSVVRQLVVDQRQVRCLIQPSTRQLPLPKGVPFSAVSAQMRDVPALRAAMQDVTAVIHLTGEEAPGRDRTLEDHPSETACLIEAMRRSEVSRIVYISRLGADAASAYRLFRVRGETEALLVQSGLEATLLQPAITYGAEDAFTNVLAMIAKTVPAFLPIPDPGMSRFQPLLVGDLARCVSDALDRRDLAGKTVQVGGPEHFTIAQMVSALLNVLRVRRVTVRVRMPFVRAASSLLDALFPRNPIPLWMLDIVERGSATDLGSIPRNFGFEPVRFSHGLDYLRRARPWRLDLARYLFDMRN